MSENTATNEPSARELARREKVSARHVELGGAYYVLLGATVVYFVTLLLPQATGVQGWQVVTFSDAAADAGVKLTEYVFAVLCLLGIGVFTTATLITRRTALALIAWMITTVGVAYSLLAVWLRLQRPGSEADVTLGVGTYLMILVVIVAFVAYAMTVLRRSPEQREIARARAETDDVDEVARAQREASRNPGANPLLVDDRRDRSRRRAQRRSHEDADTEDETEDSAD
ncbi:hypothetical protein [Corynebacterium frankenforstense]|uniref:Rv2732c family membrane protein n=1 Tax=Corynebacterium frankenforstense TaxID=1230998 RepID=UPI0026EB9099|nr:hypothetical protein [Corynebacterium frankenforstense]